MTLKPLVVEGPNFESTQKQVWDCFSDKKMAGRLMAAIPRTVWRQTPLLVSGRKLRCSPVWRAKKVAMPIDKTVLTTSHAQHLGMCLWDTRFQCRRSNIWMIVSQGMAKNSLVFQQPRRNLQYSADDRIPGGSVPERVVRPLPWLQRLTNSIFLLLGNPNDQLWALLLAEKKNMRRSDFTTERMVCLDRWITMPRRHAGWQRSSWTSRI